MNAQHLVYSRCVAVCDVYCRAQDIFKQALQTPRVELRVVFADVPPPPLPAHPPPALFRPVSWRKPLPDPPTSDVLASCEPNTSTPCKDDEFAQPPKPTPSTVTKMPPSTTSKAAPPYTASKARAPMTPSRSTCKLTVPRSDSKTKFTPFYSSRTVGRSLHIQLVKGKFGILQYSFLNKCIMIIRVKIGGGGGCGGWTPLENR